MSVIGRTYRGSLPSQSAGHKQAEEEEEGEAKKAELEVEVKYKTGMENGWEGKGRSWSENGESDLEREEKGSIYLGGDLSLQESERSQSLCSVCSRYSQSSPPPPQSLILPASSSSSTPPPFHFSPSSPRSSLFKCRECCFDNSPLSCQLVAIPAFPSPSLAGERRGRSEDEGRTRIGGRLGEGGKQMEREEGD